MEKHATLAHCSSAGSSETLHYLGGLRNTVWKSTKVQQLPISRTNARVSCLARDTKISCTWLKQKNVGGWWSQSRGLRAPQSLCWWKPCVVSKNKEPMEPQCRHADIHKEEMTKTQLSSETIFGTVLLENTPPLGDCPTVAPRRSTAAPHCWSGQPGPESSREWQHAVVDEDN